ncbi:MAG: TetR/AcrR family transcriptional regulator [bacterium]
MGTFERKEREKEHRRQAILNAARKVFFKHGMQAAAMDEVAEEAELSKGALYLYFKSKEDLYVSLLEEGLAILRRMFEEVAAKPLAADEALRQIGFAYYQYFKKYPDYFNILLFADARVLHSKVSEEVLECSEQRSLACLQVVAQVYARGVKEGAFRKDLVPIEVAITLWGISNGMIGLIANKAEHFMHDHKIDLEALMTKAWELTIDSLRATSKKR